jgi:hypothetical protein
MKGATWSRDSSGGGQGCNSEATLILFARDIKANLERLAQNSRAVRSCLAGSKHPSNGDGVDPVEMSVLEAVVAVHIHHNRSNNRRCKPPRRQQQQQGVSFTLHKTDSTDTSVDGSIQLSADEVRATPMSFSMCWRLQGRPQARKWESGAFIGLWTLVTPSRHVFMSRQAV